MYFVVQEGLKNPPSFTRYKDAVLKFKEFVSSEPKKKTGVFHLGDDSALHWHFGDFKSI